MGRRCRNCARRASYECPALRRPCRGSWRGRPRTVCVLARSGLHGWRDRPDDAECTRPERRRALFWTGPSALDLPAGDAGAARWSHCVPRSRALSRCSVDDAAHPRVARHDARVRDRDRSFQRPGVVAAGVLFGTGDRVATVFRCCVANAERRAGCTPATLGLRSSGAGRPNSRRRRGGDGPWCRRAPRVVASRKTQRAGI